MNSAWFSASRVALGTREESVTSAKSGRQVNGPLEPAGFGTCLDGEEQAAVGALRRSIREAFLEEVTPET